MTTQWTMNKTFTFTLISFPMGIPAGRLNRFVTHSFYHPRSRDDGSVRTGIFPDKTDKVKRKVFLTGGGSGIGLELSKVLKMKETYNFMGVPKLMSPSNWKYWLKCEINILPSSFLTR